MKFLDERWEKICQYMRNRSIFSKILIGYLVLALSLVVMTCVTSYLVVKNSLIWSNKADLLEKARVIADVFTEEGRSSLGYARMRTIENLTEAQMIYVGQDMVARRIPKFVGPDGAEYEETEEMLLEMSSVIDALDVQLVKSILSGSEACDLREVEFMGGQVLFAGAPIYDEHDEVSGAAILYLPYVQVQGVAGDLVLLVVISCMVASFLSIVLAYKVSRRLADPVRVLTKSAQRLSAGHYGEPIPLKQSDEIGQLGSVLGELSYRLKDVISALRDEKSKLEQILSGIGEGIVAVDRNGEVVHHNGAALALLGLSCWQKTADGEAQANRERLIGMLNRAAASGEREETGWKRQDGRSIAVSVWPMTGESGEGIGAVALLRDISEAERLEQMRRDYVANISHELRTPLTGIRGMTEPLIDGYIETEAEKMDCYRVIYQETLRLEKLIGEMLDLSRLQAGRAQVEMEPMRVEGILEAAQRRMKERAQNENIRLEEEIPGPLPEVMGNEDRILQVLIILLDNALSFTPSGGRVTLLARTQDRKVHIGVRDTGAGIDPADLPYIWERFYKADKSRMRTTGTGLGLTIARLVVECMGGLITVKSEPGKGAEFEFTLGICGEEQAETRRRSE